MAVIDGEILCIYDAISPQKIITSFQNYATPRAAAQLHAAAAVFQNSKQQQWINVCQLWIAKALFNVRTNSNLELN